MKEWFKKNIISKRFNLASVIGAPLTIALAIYFCLGDECDTNYIYYLISITAIYSTIQLTFLLQKISALRTEKEKLMFESIPLWKSLSEYRYLVFIMESQLKNAHHRSYKKALSLGITIPELTLLDMGNVDRVDESNLAEFNKAVTGGDWLHFVLLVKVIDKIVNDHGGIFQIDTNNRIFACNNNTVNDYLFVLINCGIFELYGRIVNSYPENPDTKSYLASASDKIPFLNLKATSGAGHMDKINEVLSHLDKYIVNSVLLPLYDNTFIIEKNLPNHFIHLLWNAMAILLFGTVLPLTNAFIFQSLHFTRFCGGMSIGLLILSMVFICLALVHEHGKDLFTYSKIVYQGKNDGSR